MKSPEEFFSERKLRISLDEAFTSPRGQSLSTLHREVCQTASLGLEIFPVPEIAAFSRRTDLLIGEATSDIFRLNELVEEYRPSKWRVAIGPSGLCVVEVVGHEGRASLAAMSGDDEGCFTLRAERGGMTWVFFQWPKGLAMRDPAKRLAQGVRILGKGDSCPVPPSPSCRWINPGAEIEAVPGWLRELAFEPTDNPPGKVVPVAVPPHRPVLCRRTLRFEKQHRTRRSGHSSLRTLSFRSSNQDWQRRRTRG